MKRLFIIFVLALIAVPLTALAADPVNPDVSVESHPAPTDMPSEAVRPATTPLGQAVEAIRQEAVVRIQGLSAQLKTTAAGSPAARELERQIMQVKTDSQVAILRAIIDDAAALGDTERQTEAETALDHLQNPEKYATTPIPSDRPAPVR
jgi:hypothetical protein